MKAAKKTGLMVASSADKEEKAKAQETDAEESFSDENSPISDDDFNEILKMLNMGKNQNQNQGGANGFPRRY